MTGSMANQGASGARSTRIAGRWLAQRWPNRWRWGGPGITFSQEDAAELAGLLAALSRAGLPPGRSWGILAEQPSGAAVPAARVAAMLDVGGSVAEGLALARQEVTGPGAEVLTWLGVTARLADRTGAPAATVLDGLVHGIHQELDQAHERAVALAGPQATALLLSVLPAAGVLLALLMGINAVAVLAGSPAGRSCLLAGVLLWLGGRRWIARLIRRADASA